MKRVSRPGGSAGVLADEAEVWAASGVHRAESSKRTIAAHAEVRAVMFSSFMNCVGTGCGPREIVYS